MKTLFQICIVSLLYITSTSFTAHAQFRQATLQAAGLTCAMCSKAINNAVERLPFVSSVKTDLGTSSFIIAFKPGLAPDIDRLRAAVEDAGFSVAKLKMKGQFSNVAISHDEHVKMDGLVLHFLDVKSQTLNGEKEITLVDRSFTTSKNYKRFSSMTKLKCVETGKAAECCHREGVPATARVYHVTI